MSDVITDDALIFGEDYLMHYGTPRHSGRYPYGSGENPYQHCGDFLSMVNRLKKKGLSEKEIAAYFELTTGELRTQKGVARQESYLQKAETAKTLRNKGYSLKQIADKMGYSNDSSVRSLLNEDTQRRQAISFETANALKKIVDEKGMIDVGEGVNRVLNVSQTRLDEALYILEDKLGYPVYGGRMPQPTNVSGKKTTIRILCPPGTEHKNIFEFDKINSVHEYISRDGGKTIEKKFKYPESLDSKRLDIVYAEDGGTKKDGVIELRRGVPDISLGENNYSQVRILVNGTHYIKGMAVYSDDLPDGVDVRFNTNKKKGTPILGDKSNTVLKPIKKDDPNNPFGSSIKEEGGQSYYDDPNGKYTDPITGRKQSLSLINKRATEGDWEDWADAVPSQFLAKQPLELARRQLDLAKDEKMAEYELINSLTNPVVKRAMLKTFSDDCDSAAVHLKAASFPRQKFHVILPLTTMSDKEVYAPRYNDGETVALVRYPHGGTFEIPILKVNNKNPEAAKVIGNDSRDAIGINSKVAERLSGADFDGDTAMVIPCNSSKSNIHIENRPLLEGLEGFDPKLEYGGKKPGTFKPMKDTQKQMGMISNLITDMTLKGATDEELAKAVRHSMVVIDAEKHGLDYIQSEKDNDIQLLKKRWQGWTDENGKRVGGASTLISRAKSPVYINKTKGAPRINPDNGELIYREDPYFYINKKGDKVYNKQASTAMAQVKDAHELSSGTLMEDLYADHANFMKDLANKARLDILNAGRLKKNRSATETYSKELESIADKKNIAYLNKPKERMAELMANAEINSIKKANVGTDGKCKLSKDEIKKISNRAMVDARLKVGARSKESKVRFTEREWEAIQSGAMSDSELDDLIKVSDSDHLRDLALPRETKEMPTIKINKIKTLKNKGYTLAQIANSLGVSVGTVSYYLNK